MSTTRIRLKRKKSSGNETILLKAGEPYYNLDDKKLYVGNTTADDAEVALPDTQLHIAEITSPDDVPADTIEFSIGEARGNVYRKKINNVEKAGISSALQLSAAYYGDEAKRLELEKTLGTIPDGTVFFQKIDE